MMAQYLKELLNLEALPGILVQLNEKSSFIKSNIFIFQQIA